MEPTTIAAASIGIGAIFYVILDIWLVTQRGPEHAISHVIYEWASLKATGVNIMGVFLFGFIVGGLVTHFLGWTPSPLADKEETHIEVSE